MYTDKNGTFVAGSFDEMGIIIPYGKTGSFKTFCPECKDNRQKQSNQNDTPLSVDMGEQIANCHNCGQVDWFGKRKISGETLSKLKITTGTDWMPGPGKEVNTIRFNYIENEVLVNVKYRDSAKGFRLHKGAKLIFYNINALMETDGDIIITEGEIDTASYIEAGVSNVISVPNGASKGSLKLEYLDNHYNLFDNEWRSKRKLKPITRVILATDDDAAGRRLRAEFVRRLGVNRCYFVDFKGCNDPNELLMRDGKVALNNTIDKCTPAPITDVVLVSDLIGELAKLKKDGLMPGDQVGTDLFKTHYSFEKPRMTIITGVSTHGKSEFLDDIIARLAVFEGWKFAIFSPENFPIEYHISKLVSKIIGKDFNKCTDGEAELAYNFIQKHFFWIYPEDNNYKLDNLLRITDQLVSRYGVNGMIIDPWTEVDKGGQHTTENINEFLTDLNKFKRDRDCHIFLVAHPTKMGKNDDGSVMVPDLMDISGSANFFNKTDGGLTVYRDFVKNTVKIFINKVKFKHLGNLGFVEMDYNIASGRYEDINDTWDDSNWLLEDEQMTLQPIANDDITVNNEFDASGLDVPF